MKLSNPANVYADLNFVDPDAMFRKAQIVSRLQHIVGNQKTQITRAAGVVGITSDELERLLHGHFEDVSEKDLGVYLAKLLQAPH